jgi:uncharacterized membrane protein
VVSEQRTRRARAGGFFDDEEEAQILEAIRAAERATSGEIRVHVESRCPGDPMDAARERFLRLGMAHTAARNGVLFYLATQDGRFAVFGDEGIHQQVGDAFWQELRDRMSERFRRNEFALGLAEAIGAVGTHLATNFPRAAEDRNELPDTISWEDKDRPH